MLYFFSMKFIQNFFCDTPIKILQYWTLLSSDPDLWHYDLTTMRHPSVFHLHQFFLIYCIFFIVFVFLVNEKHFLRVITQNKFILELRRTYKLSIIMIFFQSIKIKSWMLFPFSSVIISCVYPPPLGTKPLISCLANCKKIS